MECLQITLTSGLKGLRDAIFGVYTLYQISRGQPTTTKKQGNKKDESGRKKRSSTATHHEDAPVMYRIFQCCALNGIVFWLSIVFFYRIFFPASQSFIEFVLDGGNAAFIWSWLSSMLSFTFSALWVIPLFCLSRLVNSLWFQDIAESAYRRVGGRRQHIPGVSKLIADFFFSIIVQFFFLIQAMLFNLLPISPIGQLVSLFHMCLLYSLYAFEYKWYYMGLELHKRLSFIENNWPYFAGFGLPLALLTALEPSFIISGCIFSILFPLFIISANEAEPVVGVCECPIRLFSPVIWLSNAIFQRTMTPNRPSLAGVRRNATQGVS